MDNEIESLRWKLRKERRALRIAESGFILGSMGFGWGVWSFSSAHRHDPSVLVCVIGAAIVGVVLEQALVAVYHAAKFQDRRRDENRRLGRVLHGRENGKN